jgi:hypothetical protein
VIASELAAEYAATIEGGRRQKVDCGEEKVDPDDGAEKVCRGEPGPLEKADLRRDGEDDGSEDEAEEEVRDGADDA